MISFVIAIELLLSLGCCYIWSKTQDWEHNLIFLLLGISTLAHGLALGVIGEPLAQAFSPERVLILLIIAIDLARVWLRVHRPTLRI